MFRLDLHLHQIISNAYKRRFGQLFPLTVDRECYFLLCMFPPMYVKASSSLPKYCPPLKTQVSISL